MSTTRINATSPTPQGGANGGWWHNLFRTPQQYLFLQLCCGIWCAVLVGVTYAFGILTHEMKDRFNLNQGEITTISTVGMSFAFFCFPAGVAYDRWGPKVVIIAASLMMSLGFIGNALIFKGVLPGNVTTLSISALFTFWPAGWFDIGTLMTNLFNFPHNRGEVIIIQKTFMGLGPTILSAVYSAFFYKKFVAYSLFVAGFVLLFGFIGAAVIQLPPEELERRRKLKAQQEKAEEAIVLTTTNNTSAAVALDKKRRMRLGMGLLVLNMVFLVCCSVVTAYVDLSIEVRIALGVLALVFLFSFLALPLMPPSKDVLEDDENRRLLPSSSSPAQPSGEEGVDHKEQSTTEDCYASPTIDDDEGPSSVFHQDGPNKSAERADGTTRSFLQNIRGLRLWLMWFISFSIWGSNAVVVLNLSQIYRAVNDNHYDAHTNAMYVALSGVGSALGRIGVGCAEFYIRRKYGISHITKILVIPGVLTTLSFALFLFIPAGGVFLPFISVAFGSGMSWGITVLLARILWKRDVGKHYNFLFSGALASLLIFNRGMFGTLYAQEGHKQGNEHSCAGVVCFEATFSVLVGLNVAATGAAYYIHRDWMTEISS